MTMRRHLDNADNRSVADVLERVARLTEDRHRAAAWHRAGEVVRRMDRSIARVVREEGLLGVERLPRIGAGIGSAIVELVETGRLGSLARLEANTSARPPAVQAPSVALLLDVDRVYRDKAARNELKTIAPARFNPDREAWLPVWHTMRGEWRFTALFSNTERAHERGATHDWVVVYAKRGPEKEQVFTVVTEVRGPLAGERVVRGREEECAEIAWRGRIASW